MRGDEQLGYGESEIEMTLTHFLFASTLAKFSLVASISFFSLSSPTPK